MSAPSNTIIIAGLSKTDFAGQSSFASNLRQLLEEKHIPIIHWAPLKSFARIIVVFRSAKDAFNAKLIIGTTASHNDWCPTMKVFFTQHTPLSLFEKGSSPSSYLQLPDAGKLWLISPPPSPPVGWVSRPEDAPNKEETFSPDDLNQALLRSAKKLERRSTVDMAELDHHQQQPGKKLTRSITLHESMDVDDDDNEDEAVDAESSQHQQSHKPSGLPRINTDLPHSPASNNNSALSTPSIVLQWEEDEEENNNSDHELMEEGGSVINSGGGIRTLPKTELPPVASH